MAEEREELVGGTHPKKNKPGACCLLLVAWKDLPGVPGI